MAVSIPARSAARPPCASTWSSDRMPAWRASAVFSSACASVESNSTSVCPLSTRCPCRTRMRFTAPERSARATPDSTGSTFPLVETRLEMLSRAARAKVTWGGRPRCCSSLQSATPAMASTITVSQRRLDFIEGFRHCFESDRVTLHILMLALVLSGGGLFGAWQAGAWSVLAGRIAPDLIVGASVGSLNGYLIASGATPEELAAMWLDPAFGRFADLPSNIRRMMAGYTPRMRLAITATELPRMKPRIFRDSEITWRHLAASCALPFALPQIRIGTQWYSD